MYILQVHCDFIFFLCLKFTNTLYVVYFQSPPNLLVGTFKELIAYLTKNPEWDDMCKVRAIFRWVSSVDVYSLKTENDPPTHSPLEYFLKIQKNMGNHAHLVSGLCQ